MDEVDQECSPKQLSSLPCVPQNNASFNNKIVLYLVSNCVKGDMELNVYFPQQQRQQQVLSQSDYDVEVVMKGNSENTIL